jgi:hypothetical protein
MSVYVYSVFLWSSLQVAVLRLADHRLCRSTDCVNYQETEKAAKAQQAAV